MVSKLNVILEASRTEYADPADLMAAIEAEERGGDGLCPVRTWCFDKRLRVSKHAWNWHRCGFEQHHVLRQCHESDDGHERILDRGDIQAHCVGAAFCGEKCHHAAPHRWDPLVGCHAVKCRKLAAVLEAWNEELKGPAPDVDTVVVCEQT